MRENDEPLQEQHNHRFVLVRKAIIYTPAALIATALFAVALSSLLSGNVGAIIGTVILAIIAFAVDFEAVAALRDLRAEPTVTIGRVQRVWSKARILFFGRAHYLLIKRQVYEVDGVAAAELADGDPVQIEHWPHTNIVISLRRAPESAVADAVEG